MPPETFFDSRWERFTRAVGQIQQSRAEMQIVYSLLEAIPPLSRQKDVFVEIGSYSGGALYTYAGALACGATVISIDDGWNGPPVTDCLKQTIEGLRHEGFVGWRIGQNSHQEDTLACLRKLLGGRPVDFLHIDGDHSEAGALKDWEMYSPLVRAGGIVAMHDINTPRFAGAGAAWRKLKAGFGSNYVEINGPPEEPYYHAGIGIVWMGGS